MAVPYDIETLQHESQYNFQESVLSRIYDLDVSPDGLALMLVLDADVVHQWQMSAPFQVSTASDSGKKLALSGQQTNIFDGAFSHDGNKWMSLGSDGRVFDYETPKNRHILTQMGQYVGLTSTPHEYTNINN